PRDARSIRRRLATRRVSQRHRAGPARCRRAAGAPISAGEDVPPWSIHARGNGKVEQVARATALPPSDLAQKRPRALPARTRYGSRPLRPFGRQRQFGTTTPSVPRRRIATRETRTSDPPGCRGMSNVLLSVVVSLAPDDGGEITPPIRRDGATV